MVTQLDREPLGDAAWRAAADRVAPYIGERVVDLIVYAASDEAGITPIARDLASELTASGEVPASPQVTETESVLISWARELVRDPEDVPAPLIGEVTARVRPEVQASVRALVKAITAER